MAYRYTITRIVVFIMTLVLSTHLLANNVSVRNDTLGILSEGVKHIKSVARPYERRIIDEIKISVPISPAPVRVRAFLSSSGREIELSTGYSAITRMIVSGYLIEDYFNIKGFGEEYARYTASTYATGRFGGGNSPWVKAKLTENQTERLLSSERFNNDQHGAHLLVLWYVLAHEIGHHVLGHAYGDGVSLSKIREQEKEADEWASRIFIALGLPPAGAFPSHMYWYYLDEYGVKNEYRRSHPPELKRIRSMLRFTIQRFDDWNNNEKLISRLPREKTINTYKSLLYYVEDLISKQTSFNESKENSVPFKECMRFRYNSCLKSCQEKYGNPLSVCKSKLCVSDKSTNIWKLRCDEIIE
ncbi:hypothetical protein L1D59_16075 [Pseudoalteromonas piscicida]|uniref:hypothetical protein n=1 Tax=Pseudoalteromonas piscicida TaxID=43662 RepID=UPI001EFE25AA|nr:hypothetical protein [Pseudoalteromonas piscicida]MCG9770117.1 hypothetical protein [Pseudoalteromonas piscicida]